MSPQPLELLKTYQSKSPSPLQNACSLKHPSRQVIDWSLFVGVFLLWLMARQTGQSLGLEMNHDDIIGVLKI